MAAVAVFWSKGYRDTAIADLERATGLNRSSLYTAFGTKQAIFSLAGKAPAAAAPAGRAWHGSSLTTWPLPVGMAGGRAPAARLVPARRGTTAERLPSPPAEPGH